MYMKEVSEDPSQKVQWVIGNKTPASLQLLPGPWLQLADCLLPRREISHNSASGRIL